MERYYPVKNAGGGAARAFALYENKARDLTNLTFIGRCGTYQYLDMHQVVNQSMMGVSKFISSIA
jgi:UDP-galactopyranose mutase